VFPSTVHLVFGAVMLLACDPRVDGAGPRATGKAVGVAIGPTASGAPRRGRLLAGERVARIPRWPAAATIDHATRERLTPRARAAVDRSPVPVLVPADPAWLASVAVFTSDAGYALAAHDGELGLTLQASRIATLIAGVGHVRGNHRLRGVDGFISANDGIRTAAWIEHGVAYSLDLECHDPDGPGCSDAALRTAVLGLVHVGGIGGAP